jgi:heme O synthase-like polyprenyltransferase
MYKHNLTTTKAWRRFLELMKPSKWWFLLYGLFYALLLAAAGMGVMLVILLTCCIAICPLSLPYISAVIMLPITVFFRAYSLEYLAQYGKEYDVFN